MDVFYQFKSFYPSFGKRAIVAVPEAKVLHPWWNNGGLCYSQITGWARGDSLCISEWPEKTFLAFPNWIEHICFLTVPFAVYFRQPLAGSAVVLAIAATEFLIKGTHYTDDAWRVVNGTWLRKCIVAIGAGSVLSAREATRTLCAIQRGSLYSIFRRVDWFDGQKPTIKLDIQLGSFLRFCFHSSLAMFGFRYLSKESTNRAS